MEKVVLASNNPAKISELQQLLTSLNKQIIPQAVLNVPEVAEPFQSFLENALLKARHASKITGLAALADDSGLCVPALQGAPGVLSARYAGEPRSDCHNNEKLLHAMQNVIDRRAYYYTVLVWIRHDNDPQPVIAEGYCFGEIAKAPKGTNGFGYDPLFWIASKDCTMAQLSMAEKNQISHRHRALQQLIKKLTQEVNLA